MSKILDDSFDPKAVHDHFMVITGLSHPSEKENPVREYVLECARKIDNVDVAFYTPEATDPGQRIIVLRREGAGNDANAPYVTLQAHMDMVCYPKDDIFPLHVFGYDDDQGVKWIKAGEEASIDDPQKGTTLGADDGIGVATILAILEDDRLKNYPIECLFTVQEETDMGGAAGLDPSLLKGRQYINLDAEYATIIIYGSAGGCNVQYEGTVTRSDMPDDFSTLKVSVSGLRGGHSGININRGRLNAIKALTEALIRLNKRLTDLDTPGSIASYDLRLVSLTRDEEPKMNAIPSSASAVIALLEDDKDSFESDFTAYCEALKAQYQPEEQGFDWEVEQKSTKERPTDESSTDALLCLLQQIPHGVIRMIPDNSALVETSTNLAAISIEGDKVVIRSSDRSSNDQSLTMLTCIQKMIGCCFDFKVLESDGYPAWQPNEDSQLLKRAQAVYEEVYGDDCVATVIHAGLECGYVVQKYGDEMDCISIGPTIVDPHSGGERLQASTVEQFYEAVVRLLQELFSK
jgi:dipeptidase D